VNPIDKLKAHYDTLDSFEHLRAMSGWDQATMMPVGGAEARSDAMSALALHIHKLLSEPRILDWIDEARNKPLSNEDDAFLREAFNSYMHANKLPESLIEAKSKAGAKCELAWRVQRKENDWAGFLKNFETVVALSKEEAEIRKDGHATAYDAMMDLYEPGMTSSMVESVFNDVEQWLPSLIAEVIEKQKTTPDQSEVERVVHYPRAAQKQLSESLMHLFGFDFERGRLDVSMHPFCGGVSDDTRITTRYDDTSFIQAMMGVIHETGHARYEQSLPAHLKKYPVGKARSMGIHESQSLFFEMQIARDERFIPHLFNYANQHLASAIPTELGLMQFQRQIQRVDKGYIRVDADEVTYPAHVILRYQIEKALINGEINVSDIPELWDQKMQHYLGLSTKGNYRNGCMQDIHWTDGSFGYFPSYTLGAMYAAQFRAAMSQEVDVAGCFEQADLKPIQQWLNTKIWSKGSVLTTNELVKQATGEALNAAHFKAHLETRYL